MYVLCIYVYIYVFIYSFPIQYNLQFIQPHIFFTFTPQDYEDLYNADVPELASITQDELMDLRMTFSSFDHQEKGSVSTADFIFALSDLGYSPQGNGNRTNNKISSPSSILANMTIYLRGFHDDKRD